MSVEKLITVLRKEAFLKEEAILLEAQEKAEEIISTAEKKAGEVHSETLILEKELARKNEEARLAKEKILARRKTILEQNKVLSKIFSECSARLRQFMDGPAYPGFIKNEYAKMEQELGKIDEVRADPKTAAVLNAMKIPRVAVDERLTDGFTTVGGQGKTKIHCLFNLRLKKVWGVTGPRFVARMEKAAKIDGAELKKE